jgi:hypothetical protein
MTSTDLECGVWTFIGFDDGFAVIRQNEFIYYIVRIMYLRLSR